MNKTEISSNFDEQDVTIFREHKVMEEKTVFHTKNGFRGGNILPAVYGI